MLAVSPRPFGGPGICSARFRKFWRKTPGRGSSSASGCPRNQTHSGLWGSGCVFSHSSTMSSKSWRLLMAFLYSMQIRNTMTKVHAFLTKSLGGQSHQFFHICLARSQERGHDLPTLSGELVPVAAADFFDNPVCPQTCQRPRNSSALAMGLSRIGLAWIQRCSHVPVAKTTHRPFAPAEDLQRRCVRLRPRVERAMSPPGLER